MTPEELVRRYPRLYHMAHRDSWDSISTHGLLSTSALLDLFEIEGPTRDAIESARRPETVRLDHAVHGVAYIRDNKPITDRLLERCLTGMEVADWYRTLNSRVFFWLSEGRLSKLLCAGAYRAEEHTVLTVDTQRLIDRHAERVTLSPINSGAIHPGNPVPRGSGTFHSIQDYPFAERRHRGADAIVELAVDYSVPDIAELTLSVDRRGCGT